MTIVKIYRNKRNAHKFIEVHEDGHSHSTVRQFMHWENGVKNLLGDRLLHRWHKKDLLCLLEDYVLIETIESHAKRKVGNYEKRI